MRRETPRPAVVVVETPPAPVPVVVTPVIEKKEVHVHKTQPARESHTPRPQNSHTPRPAAPAYKQPEKPPLGGAKSLREALEQATGHKPALQETLGKIAPKASEPKPATHTPTHKPHGIPDNVLREMLAVDEPDESI